MDFLIEHIGQMILAVICSGMILVLFVTGEDAQMTQIGTMVIQRNDTCFKSRGDTNYSIAQEKEDIRIFYEEKTYLAGEKVEILKDFVAKNSKGKKLPVELSLITPAPIEILEDGVIFPKPGVYTVRVKAAEEEFEVEVPVVCENKGEMQ